MKPAVRVDGKVAAPFEPSMVHGSFVLPGAVRDLARAQGSNADDDIQFGMRANAMSASIT